MLGRLARWLRLLGFDTLYFPDIADSDLLKAAVREERLLLTRDTHFLTIKNLKHLFIVHSENPLEQVIEVMKAFNIQELGFGRPACRTGRCARCNGVLAPVEDKGSLRDLVPEYVFLTHNLFHRCESCGNVYWEGTHMKRFRELLGKSRIVE